jgi:hypothetical protein
MKSLLLAGLLLAALALTASADSQPAGGPKSPTAATDAKKPDRADPKVDAKAAADKAKADHAADAAKQKADRAADAKKAK